MSEHPIERRLECWVEWALQLKHAIETHYRPEVTKLAAAVDERERMLWQAHDAFKPDVPLESFLRDLEYLASPPDGNVYDPTSTSDRNGATYKLQQAEAALAEKQAALNSMEADRDLHWDEKDRALADLAMMKAALAEADQCKLAELEAEISTLKETDTSLRVSLRHLLYITDWFVEMFPEDYARCIDAYGRSEMGVMR